MVTERDCTQCNLQMIKDYALKTYIMLLANVTQINLIKRKKVFELTF